MTTIQTSDGTQYQKPGFLKTAAGVYAGCAVSGAVQTALSGRISSPLMAKMPLLNVGIDKLELRNAIPKALKEANTGVRVVDLSTRPMTKPFGTTQIVTTIQEFFDNAVKSKKTPKTVFKEYCQLIKKIVNKKDMDAAINGTNAFFLRKSNKIAVNVEKFGLSVFHEIGHAINYNNSKFWKTVQKIKTPFAFIPAVIAGISLFKRKKAEGEQPKNFLDKSTDFIRNNAGKLTVLSFAPILAEELMATVRGNKLAKNLLSPELFKKVVKSNALGFATYVGAAAFAGLGITLGIKVRDAIAKPKVVENK